MILARRFAVLLLWPPRRRAAARRSAMRSEWAKQRASPGSGDTVHGEPSRRAASQIGRLGSVDITWPPARSAPAFAPAPARRRRDLSGARSCETGVVDMASFLFLDSLLIGTGRASG